MKLTLFVVFKWEKAIIFKIFKHVVISVNVAIYGE